MYIFIYVLYIAVNISRITFDKYGSLFPARGTSIQLQNPNVSSAAPEEVDTHPLFFFFKVFRFKLNRHHQLFGHSSSTVSLFGSLSFCSAICMAELGRASGAAFTEESCCSTILWVDASSWQQGSANNCQIQHLYIIFIWLPPISAVTHLLWETLIDLIGELLHLPLFAVGVAAWTRDLNAVAFQDGSFYTYIKVNIRHFQRLVPRSYMTCSPILARRFISLRRLANQLYTFNAVTRSNSDSLQPEHNRE